MRRQQTIYSLQVFVVLSLARSCSCLRHFHSQDAVVRLVIEQCEAQIPNRNEHLKCYDILRCILNQIPCDYLARWSAGASILGFVPTIVALMSNSISEVTSIADESTVLAIALSISSVTAFNSRSGNKAPSFQITYTYSGANAISV